MKTFDYSAPVTETSPAAGVPSGPVPRRFVFLIAAMGSIGPFAIDTYLPALPAIGRDLAASPVAVQQTLSIYLLAFAAMTLWHGALSDALGRRRVLLVGFAVFALASVGAALAGSIEALWAWRALQGAVGGAGLAISRAVARDVAQGADAQRLMSQSTMVFALAPAIAPMIGGVLEAWFGWRAVFAATLPLAFIALLLTRRILARLPRPARAARIDIASVLLLAGGLSALMIALTRLGQGARLLEATTLLLVSGAALLLGIFGRRQFRVAGPVMAPDLLTEPQVLWASLSSALVFFAMTGGAVMLPLALQAVAGHPPDRVALLMLLHALAVPCGAFFSGRMMPRTMRFRRNMLAGSLLAASGSTALALLHFGSPLAVAGAMFATGLGIGISLPPGIVAVQVAVAPGRIGAVTAFLGLARSLGSALGLAILGAVLFAVIGAAGAASPATLIREAAAGDPALARGFAAVFACNAAALVLSALATTRLPATVRGFRPPLQ